MSKAIKVSKNRFIEVKHDDTGDRRITLIRDARTLTREYTFGKGELAVCMAWMERAKLGDCLSLSDCGVLVCCGNLNELKRSESYTVKAFKPHEPRPFRCGDDESEDNDE